MISVFEFFRDWCWYFPLGAILLVVCALVKRNDPENPVTRIELTLYWANRMFNTKNAIIVLGILFGISSITRFVYTWIALGLLATIAVYWWSWIVGMVLFAIAALVFLVAAAEGSEGWRRTWWERATASENLFWATGIVALLCLLLLITSIVYGVWGLFV